MNEKTLYSHLPDWMIRESEIFAVRMILIYLDENEDAAAPAMWAIEAETGIEPLAFEAARRSAFIAARSWKGREDVARKRLLERLGELMPA